MAKLKLDLHDIFNRGREIETELNRVVSEAVEKRLAVFREMTLPVIEHYTAKERLIRIDSDRRIEDVALDVALRLHSTIGACC